MTDIIHETTPGFLVKRTGLNAATLHKRLMHKDCPPWESMKWDARGRVWRLRISQATLEYLLRPVDETKRNRKEKSCAVQ